MAWPLVWLESRDSLSGGLPQDIPTFHQRTGPDHLITLSQVHCTHCDAAFWYTLAMCTCDNLCVSVSEWVCVCDHYCRPLIISYCGCSLLPLIGRSLLQYPLAPVSVPSLDKSFRLCCCCCPNDGCVFIACAPKNKLTCRIFTLTIFGLLLAVYTFFFLYPASTSN